MNSMKRLTCAALGVLAVAGISLAVACGGDSAKPLGQRVTDPAAVPTSTPLVFPLVYQIRGDVVSTTGGSGTLPAGVSATPSRSGNTYTVAAGDKCASIAAQFKITVDELRKNNRTINDACNNLKIGDVLKVQGASTPTPSGPTPKTSGKEYKILSGDTCGAIAASYGVDVEKLIQANGIDCSNLKIGQTIKIP